MTALRWGSATDVGRIREINQDTALVDPEHRLFAVADGMGGHVGGEVASKIAVEALQEYRREFRPARDGAQPYSAMSVLTFASEDEDDVVEFAAAWAITAAA